MEWKRDINKKTNTKPQTEGMKEQTAKFKKRKKQIKK